MFIAFSGKNPNDLYNEVVLPDNIIAVIDYIGMCEQTQTYFKVADVYFKKLRFLDPKDFEGFYEHWVKENEKGPTSK